MIFLDKLFQLLQFSLDFEILFRFSCLIAVTISVLWIISNAYHALVSRTFGRIGLLVTGAIGVPIHEISHAFLAIIFGHRIDKIVFFQFKQNERTLGWVEHTYNRKNIISSIGVLFISLAPILIIPITVQLLFYYFDIETGDSFSSLITEWVNNSNTPEANMIFSSLFLDIKTTIFSLINRPILFIILGCVSIHSAPSTVDIKNLSNDFKSLFGLCCIPSAIYMLAYVENGKYLFLFFQGMVICCTLSALMFIASVSINFLIYFMTKLIGFYYTKPK